MPPVFLPAPGVDAVVLVAYVFRAPEVFVEIDLFDLISPHRSPRVTRRLLLLLLLLFICCVVVQSLLLLAKVRPFGVARFASFALQRPCRHYPCKVTRGAGNVYSRRRVPRPRTRGTCIANHENNDVDRDSELTGLTVSATKFRRRRRRTPPS